MGLSTTTEASSFLEHKKTETDMEWNGQHSMFGRWHVEQEAPDLRQQHGEVYRRRRKNHGTCPVHMHTQNQEKYDTTRLFLSATDSITPTRHGTALPASSHQSLSLLHYST